MTEEAFDMRWIADRLDRLEAATDDKFERLAEEIKRSRHGLREVVDTIGVQVAELVPIVNEHERRICEAENSHRRKGDRIAKLERRDSFLSGGLAAVSSLFVLTVGAILAVVR